MREVNCQPIDLLHQGVQRVIGVYLLETDDGPALFDSGPATCYARLSEQVDIAELRHLLLSHVHLDHAGAAGLLVRDNPHLQVHVSEIGLPHVVDPTRLIASARRIYGDTLDTLFGEPVPVPAENVHVAGHRELGLVSFPTPGHASHHVSFLHEDSGWAFVGDVAGVRIPPSELVVAPTPPPDIDVAAWERSLDLVAGWSPARLALTHWGEAEDPAEQLEACRRALREEAALAGEQDLDGFMATLHERIAAESPELIETYEQAAPLDHLYLGLDRWHSKQAA